MTVEKMLEKARYLLKETYDRDPDMLKFDMTFYDIVESAIDVAEDDIVGLLKIGIENPDFVHITEDFMVGYLDAHIVIYENLRLSLLEKLSGYYCELLDADSIKISLDTIDSYRVVGGDLVIVKKGK